VDGKCSLSHARGHWLLKGRVQGVGFRWFTMQLARRHGVEGDVRNLPDGRVEVRAAGPAGSLTTFETELRQGPPGADVTSVERVEPDADVRFTGFDIR
jgi:acylphosphatase